MSDTISLLFSFVALAISAVTAYLTLFRRGTVKMTQPTTIFFGPDGRGFSDSSKVYFRTLLFATSKRGRIIESMHIALFRTETQQIFNIWVFGDEKLSRGSGLFVGENGIAANHHFLTPEDAKRFRFLEGKYKLKVFAQLVGDRRERLLFTLTLDIPSDIAARLKEPNTGLYFDWSPSSKTYLSHLEKRTQPLSPEEFLKLMMPERISNEQTKGEQS